MQLDSLYDLSKDGMIAFFIFVVIFALVPTIIFIMLDIMANTFFSMSLPTLSRSWWGTIVERLESVDDGERVYSYSIESGPLPVADYSATIRVREGEDGSTSVVEWTSEFNAAGVPEGDAVGVIQGIYQAGFDNLRKLYGG